MHSSSQTGKKVNLNIVFSNTYQYSISLPGLAISTKKLVCLCSTREQKQNLLEQTILLILLVFMAQ